MVEFPKFQQPGEEPEPQPVSEKPAGLFEVDEPDTTQALPHP